MTKGHVLPANLNKNREVIFQFEPNEKEPFQFSYEKSPIPRLSNKVVPSKMSRKKAVFFKTSAGMFAAGKKINVTFFCSSNSRRKCNFMAKCFVFPWFIEFLLRAKQD